MDLYTIVLRLIHIFAGVFWVGGVIVYVRFLEPAAKATAPAGQKFMQQLMQRQQFAFAMGGAGVLTVLAGILLYLKDSSGLQLAWITTPVGIGFTIGALLAIAALLVGFLGLTPRAARVAALGTQIESAGAPPTPQQVAEMSTLNQSISQLFRLNLILLSLALAAMATARYW
jgi:uncharacterized membrane protein